ncbi:helix-turn-helix transcriptional regulator [Pedobacter sp. WC2423]|uniref:helix-turn-helix transcriptional regulator n=1 Tax=Pedobacter sp. WC2423 TaxID=3234142 RepID=UPI003467339D
MKRINSDQITTYNSISEFLLSLGKLEVQENDFSISSLDCYLSDEPMKSNPFRTNFFNFLMIVDGAGSYTIDNVLFKLMPASFYFTTPGHLKSFIIEKPWKGFILSFTEKFIKEYYLGNLFKEFPFLVAETTPPIYLNKDMEADVSKRLDTLLEHYQTESKFKYQMITNILIAFLYKVKEMLFEAPRLEGQQFGYSMLVVRFRKYLDDHFRDVISGKVTEIFNGNQIASALAVSADHLGSEVKKETGRTLTKWITDRTIMEAQCLLKNSSLSISEIAYKLTFSDPTNFTKYFKKNTGFSPKQYRDQ